tara:strand:+ start:537 stop:1061 length:525 start_codon:yes stop_codon:yes gene_type:complete
MTLPSSGSLSLNQIHIEAGGSSGTICTLNDEDIRGIIGKTINTSNSILEYYGASSISIQSGDGFYYHHTMGQNASDPSQPDLQNAVIWVVVKLGGNIVKGSLSNQTDAYAFTGPRNSVIAGANQSSYTHTNGQVYVPNAQINNNGSNLTTHFPDTSFSTNLSTYDDFGIKLQGT